MRFTEEELEFLSQFENNMEYALTVGWVKNVRRSDRIRLLEINNKYFKKEMKAVLKCGDCLTRIFKNIAEAYFNQINNEIIEDVIEMVVDQEEIEIPKKNKKKKDIENE